jgi:hypothetical protein
VIQELQDMATSIAKKMSKPIDFIRDRKAAKEEAKKQKELRRKLESDRELLKQAGLPTEEIDMLLDSPFSDKILRIVDDTMTSEKNKK